MRHPGPAASDAFAGVDHVVADTVARGVVPGLVAAIADRDGVRYTRAAGRRDAGDATPMTVDTIFWIASMTKLVTTVAVMQQVEAGALDLDAPVAPLLPELANPAVLTGFDAAGTPVLRPARNAITLRQLLTHTSGSGYDAMHPALLRARGPAGAPPPGSRAALLGPLASEPGEGWHYGFGIDWAGIAVERSAGMALAEYFATRIFAPLAMVDTAFDVAPTSQARCAAMHLRTDDGVAVIPSPGIAAGREIDSGGAGLWSTAGDYLRLLRMLLSGGELDGARVLRAATVAAMWDNQVGDMAAGRLDTTSPALMPYDPLPGQVGAWSLLGVTNRHATPEGRSPGSAAWCGIGGTMFWLDRAAGIAGVVLAQQLPFADPALLAVQHDFERAAYRAVAR